MRDFIKRIIFRNNVAEISPSEQAVYCHKAASAVIHSEATIHNLSDQRGNISIGDGTQIRGMLLVYKHGGSITLGDHCYLGPQSDITSMDEVRIGNRVLISHHVQILDSTAHSLDAQERHRHFLQIMANEQPRSWDELPGVRSAPIIIEDDVWIGFGSTILKGVRIGEGSVIGARSIVTHDVEPGMLYHNKVVPIIKPLPSGGADLDSDQHQP